MAVSRAHAVYVIGQLGLTGAIFVFNVVVARLLGPEQTGVWQTAVLVATYGTVLTLGTVNGMGREIPFHTGQKDLEARSESIATVARVLLLVSVLPAACALTIGLSAAVPEWLLLGAALLVARLFNTFSLMLLRSMQDYTRLGFHQGSTGALLLVGLCWVWWQPTLGAVLGAMLIALMTVSGFAHPYLILKPASWSRFRALVQIGLPIMLAGVLFGLLTSVDRFLILGLLGTEELGLYTPAIMALGVIVIAPSLISNIMYPRLAQEFGRTGSVECLIPMVNRLLWLNIGSTWPVAAVLVVTFYLFVIPVILPDYTEASVPMAIVFGSAIFLPVAQSFGDLFNVIGLQRRYLRNMAIGFVGNAVAGYFLAGPMGWGLEGVAVGTVIGTALFTLSQWLTYTAIRRT